MPDTMINAHEVIERLEAIESAMHSSGGDLSGYIITGVAALIGAGIAGIVHYTASKQTLKGAVIVEARKNWLEELRHDLAHFMGALTATQYMDGVEAEEKIEVAKARILFRLTPPEIRSGDSTHYSNQHEELETAVLNASTMAIRGLLRRDRPDLYDELVEGIENKVEATETIDERDETESFIQALNAVEEAGRRVLYGTWMQIREEIEKPKKSKFKRSQPGKV